MEREQYPMKWYKFVIYVQLFLSAIVSIYNAGTFLSGWHYQGSADAVYAAYAGMKALDIAMGIISIGQAGFSIIVRQRLAKFRQEGPRWYLILLGVSAATTILYLFIGSGLVGMYLFDYTTVVEIVGSVVMIVLSKIYFDKRKELFVN